MSSCRSYAQGNDWVNAGVGTSPGQPPSAPTLAHPAHAERVHDLRRATSPRRSSSPRLLRPSARATKGVVALQGKPQITFLDPAAAPIIGRVIQLRSTSPRQGVRGRRRAPLRRACAAPSSATTSASPATRAASTSTAATAWTASTSASCATTRRRTRRTTGSAWASTAGEAYDGKAGETYDLRTMVHAIHSAGETSCRSSTTATNGIYAFGSQAAIDSRCRTGRERARTSRCPAPRVPTLRSHNEIVIHYPRALNDCNACHIDGSEIGFGDQTQRMAVTVDVRGTRYRTRQPDRRRPPWRRRSELHDLPPVRADVVPGLRRSRHARRASRRT